MPDKEDYYYCGNCLTEVEWEADHCEHCESKDVKYQESTNENDTTNKYMKVKFKKLHEHAVLPSYSKTGDAGLDLTAISNPIYDDENSIRTYKTGLAVEIPEGYVGLIFPRSSIYKKGLVLANSVGVIDSGYRGEILVKFANRIGSGMYYFGDRIAQLVVMPIPFIEPVEVEELSDTERGEGGFGSTNER